MNLSPEELTFARDLVKTSRQRIHHVKWTDRDGTERLTALNAAEAVQLNQLAHRRGVAKGELLRQVAHIPNAKAAAGSGP
jgi:predicted amidohydrolase YtcJ